MIGIIFKIIVQKSNSTRILLDSVIQVYETK